MLVPQQQNVLIVKLSLNAKRVKINTQINNQINNKILTIDGVSGVGKGTTAKIIANQKKWKLLDSGAIYRSVAYFLMQNNLLDSLDNQDLIRQEVNKINIDFQDDLVLLNNENISNKIRNEEIATITSKVANIKYIRGLLINKQRSFASGDGLVADGRDMGSRVFPEAKYKIFLTADASIRAKRRAKQLQIDDNPDKIDGIYQSIVKRDKQDKDNTYPADNALIIDNTNKSIDDVVNIILDYVS